MGFRRSQVQILSPRQLKALRSKELRKAFFSFSGTEFPNFRLFCAVLGRVLCQNSVPTVRGPAKARPYWQRHPGLGGRGLDPLSASTVSARRSGSASPSREDAIRWPPHPSRGHRPGLRPGPGRGDCRDERAGILRSDGHAPGPIAALSDRKDSGQTGRLER